MAFLRLFLGTKVGVSGWNTCCMDQCIPCTNLVKPSPWSGGDIRLHIHGLRQLDASPEISMCILMLTFPLCFPCWPILPYLLRQAILKTGTPEL